MINAQRQHPDPDGFSLIELLVVIVILGILATVVVFAVGGFTDDAENAGCLSDAKTVITATEAYFAQRYTQTIPAANATPDGYEQSLVNGGFLRSVSQYYDIDTAGQLVQVTGSPCTV